MKQKESWQQSKEQKWITRLAAAYLLLLGLVAVSADWLPLGFAPDTTMGQKIYQEPFDWAMYTPGQPFHWLGTDEKGRDVVALLVYGTRTAFKVSLPAMALAALVGISLGLLAGYYGNHGLKLSVGRWVAGVLAVFVFLFYLLEVNFSVWFKDFLGWFLFFSLFFKAVLGYLVYKACSWLLTKVPGFQKKMSVPFDLLLLKLIEILGAVPRLLLVLGLAAFFPPSLGMVTGLAMLTFWPGIARLARAEMLKQKSLPYLEAAVTLGFKPARILTRHALPNMLVPLLVAITFGICNLVVLESTLSFLGYGLPPETPSWGKAINGFRGNASAWWLLFFPGGCLLLLVLALQNINNYIIRRIQPR